MENAIQDTSDVNKLKDALMVATAKAANIIAKVQQQGLDPQEAAKQLLDYWTGDREDGYEFQAYKLWVILGEINRKAARKGLQDAGYMF